MPYKNKDREKEYKRRWIAQQRSKIKSIVEPLKSVEPVEPSKVRHVEPKKVEPRKKIINSEQVNVLLNELREFKQDWQLFRYELTEQSKEQTWIKDELAKLRAENQQLKENNSQERNHNNCRSAILSAELRSKLDRLTRGIPRWSQEFRRIYQKVYQTAWLVKNSERKRKYYHRQKMNGYSAKFY